MKVLFLNVGRSFKADEHNLEGIYGRDKAQYNLTAPIEITLRSHWNNQTVLAV